MNGIQLRSVLAPVFTGVEFRVADREYHQPSRHELQNLLTYSFFEAYQWRPEVFDCDDFSKILNAFISQEAYRLKWEKPWACGEVWGKWPGWKEHARNVCVIDTGEVLLVEPQTDHLMPAPYGGSDFVWLRV